MDESPFKFRETKQKEVNILAKLLKNLKIIEKHSDLEDWTLTSIKVPLFDYLYDSLIRIVLFFILLISYYFPLPIPIGKSILILLFKSIALSIAFGLIIKLKKELWER